MVGITCNTCDYAGPGNEFDGFYYCPQCHSQAEGVVETAIADEDVALDPATGALGIYGTYGRRRVIKVEPISFSQPESLFWQNLRDAADENDGVSVRVKAEDDADGVGPTGPGDFGSGLMGSVEYDDYYYREIRLRYVMGVQLMIQMQCKALVDGFGVSPLVCGLAGSIWLRFVACSRVFDDGWAEECIRESESQKEGMIL